MQPKKEVPRSQAVESPDTDLHRILIKLVAEALQDSATINDGVKELQHWYQQSKPQEKVLQTQYATALRKEIFNLVKTAEYINQIVVMVTSSDLT